MNIKIKSPINTTQYYALFLLFWLLAYFSCLGISCLFIAVFSPWAQAAIILTTLGLTNSITQYFTQTIQYLKTPNDVLSLYHQFKTIAKDNASQPIKEQNTLFTLFIQHYLQQRVSAIILTNQIDNELYNTFKDYLFSSTSLSILICGLSQNLTAIDPASLININLSNH